MIQCQRILVPVDFSENSRPAIQYACALAEQFRAELHVAHVIETHALATPQFGMGLDLITYARESKAAAEKSLAEALPSGWSSGRPPVSAILEGSPIKEIIHYAREQAIDLIVMSTHGRSGLAHVLVGSVAENIVRHAPCPVLTVRPSGHQFVMP